MFTGILLEKKKLKGDLMFENLSRFVKICLVLTVGNAQPERGFSENKLILEGRTNLNQNTIEALRLIKHEINLHNVPSSYPTRAFNLF